MNNKSYIKIMFYLIFLFYHKYKIYKLIYQIYYGKSGNLIKFVNQIKTFIIIQNNGGAE